MNSIIRVISADVAHAELLADIHRQCFEEVWSAAAVVEVLSMPGSFASVAVATGEAEERPAGFTLARVTGEDSELLTLCVLPAYRRRAIAATLLDDVLLRVRRLGARRLFLEVAETNDAARALYAGRGFTASRRRPDYYRAPNRVPVAALELRCDLIAAPDDDQAARARDPRPCG